MTSPHQPVRFQSTHEHVEPDETEAVAQLKDIFLKMAQTVAEEEKHASRAVHAKGQGLLRGRLEVLPGLPPELAQGLFAQAGSYEALLRLSSPPAEQLPDSVSTPRAIALKVIGVPGERLQGSEGDTTQDFLMVNGPAFSRPGPQQFVRDTKMLAATTEKAPGAKAALSAVMRGTEAALEAVGLPSARIKGMGGEPMKHPLGETYFTQTPFLYGDYIAKFSLAPVSPNLAALDGEKLEGHDADRQREAVREFFAQDTGTWELRVQLCTDLEKMPVEDASVEWPEDQSPYVAVARVTVAPQEAWSEASESFEDRIAFSPWHGLAAHRPLGAVNRARRPVMDASREFRAGFNGCPVHHTPAEGAGRA